MLFLLTGRDRRNNPQSNYFISSLLLGSLQLWETGSIRTRIDKIQMIQFDQLVVFSVFVPFVDANLIFLVSPAQVVTSVQST